MYIIKSAVTFVPAMVQSRRIPSPICPQAGNMMQSPVSPYFVCSCGNGQGVSLKVAYFTFPNVDFCKPSWRNVRLHCWDPSYAA